MAEIRVRVGEPGPGADAVAIRINGRDPSFRLGIELGQPDANRVTPRLLDLLEIACAVFSADGTVSRGGDTRAGFGEAWRRRLHFEVPVRDPDFWRGDAALRTLVAAVETLTDDAVSFDFSAARGAPPAQAYLDFSGDAPTTPAPSRDRDVILFSGGLDSLAGTVEALSAGRQVTLVTHRSAQKMFTRQKALADRLRLRFPGLVHWVPIKATRVGEEAAETTQRSRTLLFAALGLFVRQGLGGTRLGLFENGIVSHNLPISPQVIGTMATRTTHPLVLRHLSRLMELVIDGPASLPNPYAWMTKAEVVEKLDAHGMADLIDHTVSCNQVRERSILHTHCGACSQCLDRRMALVATELDGHDHPDKYETEVLTGERPTDLSRTMAVDWTRHAWGLAEMSADAFVERFGGELARIVEGWPDRPATEVARRSIDLHRRHGRAVREALRIGLERQSGAVIAKSLPATSLLRMFLEDGHGTALASPAAAASPALGPSPPLSGHRPGRIPAGGSERLFPLQVTLEGSGSSSRLTVLGLGEVSGMPASVVGGLRPEHEEDRLAGRKRDGHRFVPGGQLAGRLAMTKSAVKQNVKRCRDELAELHAVVEGTPPTEPLLIQNRPQRGYRLDPDCRFVNPSEA